MKRYGGILKERVLQEGFRNSANDLIALDVAIWKNKTLLPKDILSENYIETIPSIIADKSKRTDFLSAALTLYEDKGTPSGIEIGHHISIKLDRGWSKGSKTRYGGAAKRWISYFKMNELKSTQQNSGEGPG